MRHRHTPHRHRLRAAARLPPVEQRHQRRDPSGARDELARRVVRGGELGEGRRRLLERPLVARGERGDERLDAVVLLDGGEEAAGCGEESLTSRKNQELIMGFV